MITLCTLFNTNYIDKGLTMYESIERYTQDYVLYVLCMDDRCYEILTNLNRPRFIPIKLSDFESPELLAVKQERSMGEYCWTCSSCLVDYVMRTFNPEYCAYIDSDLYFYDDVNVVVKEMQERNASVMITGHRFNWYDRKEMEWMVGKYCVEFNTFKNDENGRSLLTTWKNQCLEYCKCDGDGVHWGDQKYMDDWCDKYEFCVETENLGAGVAHWNISQYKLKDEDEYGPTSIICKGNIYRPFFYHYQNIRYLSDTVADSNTSEYLYVDYNLVKSFCRHYLSHVRTVKNMLKNVYGIDFIIKAHPGYNFKRKSLMERVKSICNIGYIKKRVRYRIFHKLPSFFNQNKGLVEF